MAVAWGCLVSKVAGKGGGGKGEVHLSLLARQVAQERRMRVLLIGLGPVGWMGWWSDSAPEWLWLRDTETGPSLRVGDDMVVCGVG